MRVYVCNHLLPCECVHLYERILEVWAHEDAARAKAARAREWLIGRGLYLSES